MINPTAAEAARTVAQVIWDEAYQHGFDAGVALTSRLNLGANAASERYLSRDPVGDREKCATAAADFVGGRVAASLASTPDSLL